MLEFWRNRCVFKTAQTHSVVMHGEAVDVYLGNIHALRHSVSFAGIPTVDSAGETVFEAIAHGDRLLDILVSDDTHEGAEDLLVVDF